MKFKKIIFILQTVFLTTCLSACVGPPYYQGNRTYVYTPPYYQSYGTYVYDYPYYPYNGSYTYQRGYYRSYPNHTMYYNGWSTRSNVSNYTGWQGNRHSGYYSHMR